MKSLIIALGLAMAFPTLSFAQTEASVCYHAGLTYSPGSMIRTGKVLQICALTENSIGVWSRATSGDDALESANCVSGGREFSQGAILSAGAVDLRCSSGIWYPGNS